MSLVSAHDDKSHAPSKDKMKMMAKISYHNYVDQQGNMKMPMDYQQNWHHLGSSALLNSEKVDKNKTVASIHSIYAQPRAVEHYQATGEFADGTILIKEIRLTNHDSMTTGRVAHSTDIDIWFMMIKDTKGRFKGNKHWGNGWGWALFNAAEPEKNVSEGMEKGCIGCHTPVKNNDWIYTDIYPALRLMKSK